MDISKKKLLGIDDLKARFKLKPATLTILYDLFEEKAGGKCDAGGDGIVVDEEAIVRFWNSWDEAKLRRLLRGKAVARFRNLQESEL